MREHKGYLYLGGLENNRIGRIKLDGARSDLDRIRGLLGQQAAGPGLTHGRLHLFPARPGTDRFSEPGPASRSRRWTARSCPERPCSTAAGRSATPIPGADAVTEGPDGAIYVSAGNQILRLAGDRVCRARRCSPTFDGIGRRPCLPSRRPVAGLRRRARAGGDRSRAVSRRGSIRPAISLCSA